MVKNMKKLVLIICLFAAAGSLRAADPSIEETIKSIRAKYAQIEKGLKDGRQVKRDLPEESTEGGELTAWFKDRSVEKLSAKFLGEMGKAVEEYYFWNSELIFVFRVESRYTEPFSGVVRTKKEDRFYFADGKLVQWLSADKKPHPMDAEAEKRGRDLLASSKKYSAMAQ
jgi:hypothetical protein